MYVCVYVCTTYNLFATIKYEQVMKKKMIRNPSRPNQILKKFLHLPKGLFCPLKKDEREREINRVREIDTSTKIFCN